MRNIILKISRSRITALVSYTLFIALITCFGKTVHAKDIIYVPQDAPSIQEGIKMASPGDTVFVSPGIYHETNIGVYSGITLTGDDPANTIIDGDNRTYYALNVNNKANVTIKNITVIKSFGIRLENSQNVVLDNVVSRNNEYYGIRIKGFLTDGLIINTQIYHNLHGIVISGNDNHVTLAKSLIYENTNSGINILGNSENVSVFNNTIDGNYTGIAIQQKSSPEIFNNSITSNRGAGVSRTSTVPLTFGYNNIWGNASNWQGFIPDTSNISLDPLYIDPFYDNYLIDCSSPMVDAGIRVHETYIKSYGLGADIGAYELKACGKSKPKRK